MGLTFKQDDETGDVQATLDGYYHAIGISRDQAVHRLIAFLKEAHPGTFYNRQAVFDDYFAPKPRERKQG